MKSERIIVQLSLFDECQNASTSKKSHPASKNTTEKGLDKEVKVISLVNYQHKKAEERFNSYADHLL